MPTPFAFPPSAGAEIARGLEAAGAASRLRFLDFGSTRISDEAAAALGRALAAQGAQGSLRMLRLRNNWFF